MDISLRHIEVFRAVMNAGSVTGAAQLLFSSQPTVSRELARLESLLGMALFVRERGRLTPTAQGLMLFEEVQRAYVGLEQIASVAESIRRFDQGQLNITCLPMFAQVLLPAACLAFSRQYPGVAVSITAQESPALEESLSGQRYDLGLIESRHPPRGTRGFELFCAEMVAVLPAGHGLAAKARLELSDFDGQAFINLSGLDLYRKMLDEQFRRANVQRHGVIETSTAASVCAMVRQGLGVAIVNPLTALDEAARGLVLRPLAVAAPFSVSLIQPQYRPASVLVEAFTACLQTEAARLAAGRLADAMGT